MSEDQKPTEFWLDKLSVDEHGWMNACPKLDDDAEGYECWIRVIEHSAYEKLQQELESVKAENAGLKNTIGHWQIKNDALMWDKVSEKIEKLNKALKVAESALRTAVGHEPLQGLEPRKCSEALAEIRKIKGEN